MHRISLRAAVSGNLPSSTSCLRCQWTAAIHTSPIHHIAEPNSSSSNAQPAQRSRPQASNDARPSTSRGTMPSADLKERLRQLAARRTSPGGAGPRQNFPARGSPATAQSQGTRRSGPSTNLNDAPASPDNNRGSKFANRGGARGGARGAKAGAGAARQRGSRNQSVGGEQDGASNSGLNVSVDEDAYEAHREKHDLAVIHEKLSSPLDPGADGVERYSLYHQGEIYEPPSAEALAESLVGNLPALATRSRGSKSILREYEALAQQIISGEEHLIHWSSKSLEEDVRKLVARMTLTPETGADERSTIESAAQEVEDRLVDGKYPSMTGDDLGAGDDAVACGMRRNETYTKADEEALWHMVQQITQDKGPSGKKAKQVLK